eukprot:2684117-Rhodomonas_salina.1
MVLEVVVHKAEGLVAKDRGGTSDPFCEVKLGKQRQKTKVKPKTLNPNWDETFLLDYGSNITNLSVPALTLSDNLWSRPYPGHGLVHHGLSFLGLIWSRPYPL